MASKRRIVHIVGDSDAYEVLAETSTTKILRNLTAHARRRTTELETELARVRAKLRRALRQGELPLMGAVR
jgi:hypothetical protein